MATRKKQLDVPFGNGWAVVVEGRKLFTMLTTRKSQAISYARNIAKEQKTDLIIYGKDLDKKLWYLCLLSAVSLIFN